MAVKVTKRKPKPKTRPATLGEAADAKKGKASSSARKRVSETLHRRYKAKYPAKKSMGKAKKLKMPKLEKWYYSSGKKVAKKAVKKAHKTIAGKLVGKLGAPGKAIVGASLLIDYAKMKQKGKKGCGPGMSKVTKNGKSYCAPSKGSRKGRDY